MADTIVLLAWTEADGTLGRAALEALTAARSLGSEVTVGLIGGSVDAASTQVGGGRVLAVAGEAFAAARYSTDAAAAEAICRVAGATIVIAPGTSRTMRCLPGVSQRLGGAIDTHVADVQAGPSISRWFYRQRIEAVLTRQQRPWFLVVDSGAFPAFSEAGPAAAIEAVAVEVTPALTRTAVVGMQAPKVEQQTIRPDVKTLFVAGAGWTKKQKDGAVHMQDAARLILGFVNGAQASLGSSKSLVDLSGEGQAVLPFLSHLNQVGQTGSTPRHPKGLATCCHGEEPHVVGWRFIKDRRAVNLDANCGWARGKADVLYVADAFEVVEKVNAMLAQAGAASA